jgi:ribosome-binding protein aMBF1 (putative translation factor)
MQRYPHFEVALGEEVAKVRETLGLSQRQLSAKVGRRSNYISLVESGRQPLTVSGLSEIGSALNVKGSELHARAERTAAVKLPKSKASSRL